MPNDKQYSFVQLDVSRVDQHFDFIIEGVRGALPAFYDVRGEFEGVLKASLLKGSHQCWMCYETEDDKTHMLGVIITQIIYDGLMGSSTLWIFSIFGYRLAPAEVWTMGMNSLKKYAKENDCANIMAYSNVEQVVQIGEKLGAETDTSVLRWEV